MKYNKIQTDQITSIMNDLCSTALIVILFSCLGSGCMQTTGDEIQTNLSDSADAKTSAQSYVANEVNAMSGLLPVPQEVKLQPKSFLINSQWKYSAEGDGEYKNSINSLVTGFRQNELIIAAGDADDKSGRYIRLRIRPGSVVIGETTDTNRVALANQAYHLQLDSSEISISANSSQGLFYGIQTLLQLLKTQQSKWELPAGEITDWPTVNVRMIYWDDAHHLEKMDAFRRIISQAAYFKINAFAIKLEGHFKYKSAPAIIEPYALSANEYQQLTDFAKSKYIDLVPFLDAPAHVSFILKHPDYKSLRMYEDNNYQFGVTKPGTTKLLHAMFTELVNASKGSEYILLSNDEAYYTGKNEIERTEAARLGGNGRLLAWFIKQIADSLQKQGRTVLFWGEFPLKVEDISSLPSHLVNGVYNKDMAAAFKNHGIRQFVYTATQGEEPIFPSYYPLNTKTEILEDGSDRSSGRVSDMLKEIKTAFGDKLSAFMGVVIAGWGDAGLHPESFWLGYATGASAGWNHQGVDAAQLTARFHHAFYGPKAFQIDSVYRLLSAQAEFYDQSWEWIPSKWRKPILGNSEGIFETPQQEKDQTLPELPVPDKMDLRPNFDWDTANAKRLTLINQFVVAGNRLKQLIDTNQKILKGQEYNLEVLESIAGICMQNLQLLTTFQSVNYHLKSAAPLSASDPAAAVAQLDKALDLVAGSKKSRDSLLKAVKVTWHKEWQPLVEKANGRTFLQQVDDIKDHEPVRTIDLSYLIYRQLNYPVQDWWDKVISVRNGFATRHNIAPSTKRLNWKSYN